jgi:hypothetical protein
VGLTNVAIADGLTPSTTTITATPSTVAIEGTPMVEQTVTIKATVAILNPLGSLIVTPSGPVAFTVGSTSLGSATLGSCTLGGTSCSASISTNALPKGTDTVTASYHTDGFASSSSASTTVKVILEGSPSKPDTTQCSGTGSCDSGVVFAEDGSADIDVATTGGSGNYTIVSSLGGTTLSCGASGTGDTGNYVVSSNKASQTVTYQMLGTFADHFHSLSDGSACYGTTQKFTTASGHTSTYNSANGEYEGILPVCNSHASNTPCEKSQTFTANGGPSGQDVETLVVLVSATTNPCDPHLGGGG